VRWPTTSSSSPSSPTTRLRGSPALGGESVFGTSADGLARIPRHGAEQTPYALLARTLTVWMSVLRNLVAFEALDSTTVAPSHEQVEGELRAFLVLERLIRVMDANSFVYDDRDFVDDLKARFAASVLRFTDSGRYAALGDFGAMADRMRQPDRDPAGSGWTGSGWSALAESSRRPVTVYSVACMLAMRPATDRDHEAISARLSAASQMSAFAAFAPQDPELAGIRDSHWADLHPTAPASVWDVAPLSTHREKLGAVGVRTPEGIAAVPKLGRYLGLAPAEVDHLLRVATLAAHLAKNTPKRWAPRVPLLLQVLVGRGIQSVRELRRATTDLVAEVADESGFSAMRDAIRGVPTKRREAIVDAAAPRTAGTDAAGYVAPDKAIRRLCAAWA
jgi:hypothetical protein